MCEQREGSLRGQEGRGTAGDLGFEPSLVVEMKHVSFLTGNSILRCVRFFYCLCSVLFPVGILYFSELDRLMLAFVL